VIVWFTKYVVTVTIKRGVYVQVIRSTARQYFRGGQHGYARTITRKSSSGGLYACAGFWHSKIWQILQWFGVTWNFVWGDKPTKACHGDGTGSRMKMHVFEKQIYKNARNHKNLTKRTSELPERAINCM